MISTQFNPEVLLYWESLLCSEELEPYLSHPTMQMVLNGEFKNAWFKQLTGHRLFTARLNDADRALFTIVEHQGKQHLLFIDVIKNHNFNACKFFQKIVLKKYLEKNAETIEREISEQDFSEVVEDTKTSIPLQYKSVRQHHQQFISLNDLQKLAMKVHFPAVVAGSAGTGKSLVAAKLIIDYNNCNQNHEIVYLCPTEKLANQMQQLCVESDEFIPDRNKLHFTTYQKFAEKQDATLLSKMIVGFEQFKNWFEKKRCRTIDAAMLYQAFLFYAICKSQEDALKLGARKNPYTEKHEIIKTFELFKEYIAFCEKNNNHDLALQAIQINQHPSSVFVDEAQKNSPLQLMQLADIAEHQQVGFFLDPNQKTDSKILTGSFLKQILSEKKRAEPSYYQLEQSERNSVAVAEVANSILQVMNELMKGCDEFQATRFKSAKTAIPGTVSWLTGKMNQHEDYQKLLSLIKSDDCVVIVPNESSKESVKKWLPTESIFTDDEFIGLESKVVIAVDYLSNPILREAEPELKNLVEDFQPHENRSKKRDANHGGQSEIVLRSAFIAFTRAKEDLICVEQGDLKKIPLITQHVIKKSKSELPQLHEATEQDWMNFAEKLETVGLTPQATAIRNRVRKAKPKAIVDKPSVKEPTTVPKMVPKDILQLVIPLSQHCLIPKEFVGFFPSEAMVEYVTKLKLNFNEQSFLNLLTHKSFQKFFYHVKSLDNLTLFQWIMFSMINPKLRGSVQFFIDGIVNEKPEYEPVLACLNSFYLWRPIDPHLFCAFQILLNTSELHGVVLKICEKRPDLIREISINQFYTAEIYNSLFYFLSVPQKKMDVLRAILYRSHVLRTPEQIVVNSLSCRIKQFVLMPEGRKTLHCFSNQISMQGIYLDNESFRAYDKVYAYEWLLQDEAGCASLIINKAVLGRLLKKINLDRFYTYKFNDSTGFEHTLRDPFFLGALYLTNPKAMNKLAKERFFYKPEFHKQISESIFFKTVNYLIFYQVHQYFTVQQLHGLESEVTEYDLYVGDEETYEQIPGFKRLAMSDSGSEFLMQLFKKRPDLLQKMPSNFLTKDPARKVPAMANVFKKDDCISDIEMIEKTKINLLHIMNYVTFFTRLCSSNIGIKLLAMIYLSDPNRLAELKTSDFITKFELPSLSAQMPVTNLCATEQGCDFINEAVKQRPELVTQPFREAMFFKATNHIKNQDYLTYEAFDPARHAEVLRLLNITNC